MGQSSEILVKEVLKGNEAAMELLVRKNYNMVQGFIYRLIGDYNLSYDMTQEVFIKMMGNLNRFKFEDANFEAWILKIASNHCKDYFKSNSFKQRNKSSNLEMNVANIIELIKFELKKIFNNKLIYIAAIDVGVFVLSYPVIEYKTMKAVFTGRGN